MWASKVHFVQEVGAEFTCRLFLFSNLTLKVGKGFRSEFLRVPLFSNSDFLAKQPVEALQTHSGN